MALAGAEPVVDLTG